MLYGCKIPDNGTNPTNTQPRRRFVPSLWPEPDNISPTIHSSTPTIIGAAEQPIFDNIKDVQLQHHNIATTAASINQSGGDASYSQSPLRTPPPQVTNKEQRQEATRQA
jgi:hypothetical protein